MTFVSSAFYALKLIFPPSSSTLEKNPGRKSLLGAMLCIGISLIPLVAVLVVSDGMIQGITGRIIGLSTQDISVHINTNSKSVDNYEDLSLIAERLGNIEGVVQSWPEIQGMALATGGKARVGATVRAVPFDIFEKNNSFLSLFNFVEGKASLNSNSAVIGQKIANDLDLHIGDKLRLISVKTDNGRFIPKLSQFTVSGIVSCGYQELDALWVFIPITEGFSSMALQSSKFIISLVTNKTFSPELVNIKSNVIEDLNGITGNTPVEKSYTYTWNELNSSEYENFASTKILLLLIMLLIVLVASVNISSALVMIIMERRKEIAILKSVGADSLGIITAFLLIGFVAGVGGIIMGVPVGLLVAININSILNFMEKCVNIFIECVCIIINADNYFYGEIKILNPAYYLQEIPISVPFKELLVIVIGTLVLSLFVSFVPAIKAGKEKPLDILRKV